MFWGSLRPIGHQIFSVNIFSAFFVCLPSLYSGIVFSALSLLQMVLVSEDLICIQGALLSPTRRDFEIPGSLEIRKCKKQTISVHFRIPGCKTLCQFDSSLLALCQIFFPSKILSVSLRNPGLRTGACLLEKSNFIYSVNCSTAASSNSVILPVSSSLLSIQKF